jgi:restriction endonuclease Mrr
VTAELDPEERRSLRWKARSATIEALTELGGEAWRAAIVERARADGGFTTCEYDAPLPPKAATAYANPVDHALSWALTNLKRDGLVENPRRGVWRLTRATATPEQSADHIAVSRLAELRRMPYADYLRTSEWRRTRAAALERARHRCILDASHRTQLEVHHNTYEQLGAEFASDLAVLCHSCHRLHHKVNGRPKRSAATTSSPPTGVPSRAICSVPPPGWSTSEPSELLMSPGEQPRRGLSWLRRALAG